MAKGRSNQISGIVVGIIIAILLLPYLGFWGSNEENHQEQRETEVPPTRKARPPQIGESVNKAPERSFDEIEEMLKSPRGK